MSFRSLEAEILRELKMVTGDRTIRQKDIMEWLCGDCSSTKSENEEHAVLPNMRVSVNYKAKGHR